MNSLEKREVIINCLLILTVFLLSLLSCSENSNPVSSRINANDTIIFTKNEWKEDINYLAKELPARHPDLFYQLSEEEFNKKANWIKKNLAKWGYNKIVVELMKLVASVGDEHTSISPQTINFLPIRPYLFSDGMYIVAASNSYQDLIGKKISQVGNLSIEETRSKIKKVVSHSNKYWINHTLPQYICIPEILFGLDITKNDNGSIYNIEDVGPIEITLENDNSSLIYLHDHIANPLPLYLKNNNQNYWYTFLEDSTFGYFQYNRCREMDTISMEECINNFWDSIQKSDVKNIILDMRRNSGGSNRPFYQFRKIIYNNPFTFIRDDAFHFFVIIGRRTFSAAVNECIFIMQYSKAIFLGEPTGGKPNHYGACQSFTLPNSQMHVQHSTKYITPHNFYTNRKALYPDYKYEMTFEDYKNGKAPIINAILDSSYVNFDTYDVFQERMTASNSNINE
ncbi:MAG: S41 family peptidase [Candidatus Marinimicrobia bacterium]|nr:S41 family peptidase [Candidatus Neomarinimicrobiota bacterium]